MCDVLPVFDAVLDAEEVAEDENVEVSVVLGVVTLHATSEPALYPSSAVLRAVDVALHASDDDSKKADAVSHLSVPSSRSSFPL